MAAASNADPLGSAMQALFTNLTSASSSTSPVYSSTVVHDALRTQPILSTLPRVPLVLPDWRPFYPRQADCPTVVDVWTSPSLTSNALLQLGGDSKLTIETFAEQSWTKYTKQANERDQKVQTVFQVPVGPSGGVVLDWSERDNAQLFATGLSYCRLRLFGGKVNKRLHFSLLMRKNCTFGLHVAPLHVLGPHPRLPESLMFHMDGQEWPIQQLPPPVAMDPLPLLGDSAQFGQPSDAFDGPSGSSLPSRSFESNDPSAKIEIAEIRNQIQLILARQASMSQDLASTALEARANTRARGGAPKPLSKPIQKDLASLISGFLDNEHGTSADELCTMMGLTDVLGAEQVHGLLAEISNDWLTVDYLCDSTKLYRIKPDRLLECCAR